ncbi:acyl-CoA thioesterase domain-containing protein [Nocardioides insulae]|uniref:acyl-CoA thioesterase domain-containing protein n=1 Tax=Nocardioides insulae TaxID=394734 RepID=UPI000401C511|nr:acyl-CoA thioesterase domain-containing protein [Nocardioides insulae]
MTEHEAFFAIEGDRFVPSKHAQSWWTEGALHGRLFGGLMVRDLERDHGEDELQLSRLTVDLFRAAPFGPITVSTTRVRDGRRIRVADAVLEAPGVGAVARASAVFLRNSADELADVPQTPAWDAPPLAELGPPRAKGFPMWILDEDNRPLRDWQEAGERRRRAWLLESRPLVEGECLSPIVRAALAADTTSPLVHAGQRGLEYINADITMVLTRNPRSEEIGMEGGGHLHESGVAVGHATLHDRHGPIGFCTTTALANPVRG